MDRFRSLIDARIAQWTAAQPADGLCMPMTYLLGLPAKRVRPALVLMACELFGGRPEDAIDQALGIELFHNFTLMHDDIMDASSLRRGQPTVHEKWGLNTAILSGDALLVKAYQAMGTHADVLGIFSRRAVEVCKGQELDMAFEKRAGVSLEEYQEMIRLKTAVLLSAALEIGACIAGADGAQRACIGGFGEHLGLAFQLRDDVLDAFGDPAKVGKQQGGDLRMGKRTWLLIRALAESDAAGDGALRAELEKPVAQRDVQRMLDVLGKYGIQQQADTEIARHHEAAMAALIAIDAPADRKRPLEHLAALLLDRIA